jgi:hypothetical protein
MQLSSIRLLGYVALVLCFCSTSATQETKTSATITIEVKAVTGGVVAGAKVKFQAQGELETNTRVTDPAGNLLIELEPANYDLIVTSPGLEPLKRQFTVIAGENQQINLVLGFPGCPPETCIVDIVPPESTTESSPVQTQNVNIASIELFSRLKTGNKKKHGAFKEFRETQDRRILPATKFDITCEVTGELGLTTSDFLLWTSIDFLVAPVMQVDDKMDINEIASIAGWGQLAEMHDFRGVPIYALSAGETRRVAIRNLDLGRVLTSFPVGNAGNLWPWLLRIGIHIQNRAGKQIATAERTVPVWPNTIRRPTH